MKVLVTNLFFLLLAAFYPAFGQDVIDKVVVVVGENIILKSELEQYTYSLAFQMGVDLQKQPDKFDKLRGETLENMIIQKVLLVKAKEDSIVINDRQIEALLDEQIDNMVRQLGSESQVADYFGMSLRQLRREFRPEVEERLLVKTLRDRKDFEVQITRREVESFYEAYRDSLPELKKAVKISHILVSVKPNDDAESQARQKADDILSRLEKGEDFATLARLYSEDPGSSGKGGDLGLMKRGDLVREFEEVAYNLEPGQISDVVQTKFGFHIIQLISKTGEKINPRHILIGLATTEEDAINTMAWLRELRHRITRGELSFPEAAKEYSKDNQTGSKGGDLGWFEVDQFQLETFKDAVVGLEVGDISEPVKTDFGLHLVRLDDRREARRLDISKDWEQIEGWALNIKRQEEFQKWVVQLRKDVYIEIKEI